MIIYHSQRERFVHGASQMVKLNKKEINKWEDTTEGAVSNKHTSV